MNNINTYFGALDVSEKSLLVSKYLNIYILYILNLNFKKNNVKNYPIKNVEGDNNNEE